MQAHDNEGASGAHGSGRQVIMGREDVPIGGAHQRLELDFIDPKASEEQWMHGVSGRGHSFFASPM